MANVDPLRMSCLVKSLVRRNQEKVLREGRASIAASRSRGRRRTIRPPKRAFLFKKQNKQQQKNRRRHVACRVGTGGYRYVCECGEGEIDFVSLTGVFICTVAFARVSERGKGGGGGGGGGRRVCMCARAHMCVHACGRWSTRKSVYVNVYACVCVCV